MRVITSSWHASQVETLSRAVDLSSGRVGALAPGAGEGCKLRLPDPASCIICLRELTCLNCSTVPIELERDLQLREERDDEERDLEL